MRRYRLRYPWRNLTDPVVSGHAKISLQIRPGRMPSSDSFWYNRGQRRA